MRKPSIPLSQLTEVTIRSRTKSGDTPLHRAAKMGKITEIPKQGHNNGKQTNKDEDSALNTIYTKFDESDPEVQSKREEVLGIEAELESAKRIVREDFMLGLTMGFHRLKKLTT